MRKQDRRMRHGGRIVECVCLEFGRANFRPGPAFRFRADDPYLDCRQSFGTNAAIIERGLKIGDVGRDIISKSLTDVRLNSASQEKASRRKIVTKGK
jgi:hypothetical protein